MPDQHIGEIDPSDLVTTLSEEDQELVDAGIMLPPQGRVDWEKFNALCGPGASAEAVERAMEWARGDR